ncbi:TetR/AcrR family transcriptional regulator [Actinomadura flavalba]|uniref:TetR/AcrR family transcriptional regulator n=1 Tax=Actinomadura flavalba TaxID=1120938 RepID=UPI0003803385|nr:TetR/AcrR family transcriptional regulator [Actinomadura flavalba]
MDRAERILIDATRALNAEPAASTGRIAELIGISRATLHRYFATREALLHALGDRAVTRWERSLDAAGVETAAATGDPARLAATLRALLHAYTADAEEHGFALTDHFVLALPDLVARATVLEDREVAFYTACQRAGVLRADLPVRWIAGAVYGLLVTARDGARNGDVAPRDLPGLVVDTFLTGAGARPAAREDTP